MSHVTFIYPCVGRFPDAGYVRSWQMQPLSIAILSALTPATWERSFYDDRLEEIDFDEPTDLVAISIETYTARRGYQIAAEYRKRGVPVVMGGYHATFRPDETLKHADAVCVGGAEGVWARILDDTVAGALSGVYDCPSPKGFGGVTPDRSIFRGKNYFKIGLIETSRGCRLRCKFCSISAFHNATYRRRPVSEVVAEIRTLKEKLVFFVDDNVIGDTTNAKELFRALIPLKIRWISQATVDVARDPELLDLMVRSGCTGLLIGFESLDPADLATIGKSFNTSVDYATALTALRKRGIPVYGTFMFGLFADTPEHFQRTAHFAAQQRMLLAAFNHVVPFPGTPLYDQLQEDGRLPYDRWWLSEDYRFGEPAFLPPHMTPDELALRCLRVRQDFYSLKSILTRTVAFSVNFRSLRLTASFIGLNLLLRREISQKNGIPLGLQDAETGARS